MPTDIVVLLATYNGGPFLEQQLESLFSQDGEEPYLIVRDDGSKDATRATLASYKSRYPDRVTILPDSGRHLGACQSYARLLDHAVNEAKLAGIRYLMLSDQDDVWLPEKMKRLRAAMTESESYALNLPMLVHSDLKVVDTELRELGHSLWRFQGIAPERDSLSQLLLQNTVTGCTVMINRALAKLAIPIPPEAIMHDWWLALVASAFGRIVVVKEPLVLYRQHSANDTGARRYNFRYVMRNVPRLLSRPEFLRKLERHLKQADAFCQRYSDRLSEQQITMLRSFVNVRNLGFVRRRSVLLRHRILGSGWVRNMGILLRI